MEITIKFDRKEIESMIREKLTAQFPEVKWDITAGTYGDAWKAESVDPIEEARKADLLAEWRKRQKEVEEVKLTPLVVGSISDHLDKQEDDIAAAL